MHNFSLPGKCLSLNFNVLVGNVQLSHECSHDVYCDLIDEIPDTFLPFKAISQVALINICFEGFTVTLERNDRHETKYL